MLHQRKARTVNGITFRFNSDVGMDRITVTILAVENHGQRRAWRLAMKERGWQHADTVAGCWEATLERLGLNATQCDSCGMTVSYSVSGPVMCLDELLGFPIIRVEYREAAVPRGGRPQDYQIISGKGQDRVAAYIPCPHGPKPPRPKADKIVDEPSLHAIAPDATGPWA